MNESEDFFVCYDWNDPQRVVGFEIHYFSLFDLTDLNSPALAPYLEMRFERDSWAIRIS